MSLTPGTRLAQVYGFEQSSRSTGSGQAGVHGLVLELVEGSTLAERLEQVTSQKSQGPSHKADPPAGLPLDEALAVATQINQVLEETPEPITLILNAARER